jgi:hypothetical protein
MNFSRHFASQLSKLQIRTFDHPSLPTFREAMPTVRTLELLALVVCLALVISCGDGVVDTEPQDSGEQAAEDECTGPRVLARTEAQFMHSAPNESAGLGTGVTLTDAPIEHEVCVPINPDHFLSRVAYMHAWGFAAEGPREIHDKLLVPLAAEGYWTRHQLEEIGARFEDYYVENPAASLQLVVKAHLTVQRMGPFDRGGLDARACEDAPTDDAMKWFADNCGDHYIHRELLGGIVIAFADMNSVSQQLHSDLYGVILGGAATNDDGDLTECSACERVDEAGGTVGLVTVGFPGPQNQPEGGYVPTPPRDLANYMATQPGKAAQAFVDGDSDSPALGSVVGQSYRAYNSLELADCIGEDVVPHHYYSFTRFNADAGEILGLIDRILAMIDYRLDFPGLHQWPEPADQAKQELRDAQHQLSICVDQIGAAIERCRASVNTGDPLESCKMPDECKLRDIEYIQRDLPQVEVAACSASF